MDRARWRTVLLAARLSRPWPQGWQLSRRTGEHQGAATSAGRTAVRRAISVPLTPVSRGLSRSLADTPHRRSGRTTARITQIPKLIAQVVKIGLGQKACRWNGGWPPPNPP